MLDSPKAGGPTQPPVVHPGKACSSYAEAPMTNTLYYGDNLDVLRQHVATESVDLIYLDPPFNSNRSYNVLFKAH